MENLSPNRKLFKSSNDFRNFIIAGLLMLLLVFVKQVQAQVSVNIVSQPLWGPVGYNYVEYYYIPEAEVYYYVPTSQYIYYTSGNWKYATALPATYRVDLYKTYKVVINEPKPFLKHKVYVTKYAKYKKIKHNQVIIRDSRDKKYFVVKGHPGAKASNGNSAKPAKANRGGNSGNPGKASKGGKSGNPGKAKNGGNPGKSGGGGKKKGG